MVQCKTWLRHYFKVMPHIPVLGRTGSLLCNIHYHKAAAHERPQLARSGKLGFNVRHRKALTRERQHMGRCSLTKNYVLCQETPPPSPLAHSAPPHRQY